MKKLICSVILVFFSATSIYSQINEGDALLGPSLGLWAKPNVPTFGLNYESQLSQIGDVATISIGGVFRYTTFRDNYPSTDYFDYNYVTLGFQSNMNFNRISDGRFVPFLGLVLGYNNISSTYVSRSGRVYTSDYNSGMWLWAQFGTRYFFNPKVAGVLRVGAGNFNFNAIEIGVDFKL